MKTDSGNKMPQTKHAQVPARTRGEQSTPGPWKWWDRRSGRPEKYDLAYLFAGETDQSGKRILSLYGDAGNKALGRTPEDVANARLIAASPELLEACKEAMRWLDNEGDYQLKDAVRETKHSAIEMLRAAIQKAEGQQSQGFRE